MPSEIKYCRNIPQTMDTHSDQVRRREPRRQHTWFHSQFGTWWPVRSPRTAFTENAVCSALCFEHSRGKVQHNHRPLWALRSLREMKIVSTGRILQIWEKISQRWILWVRGETFQNAEAGVKSKRGRENLHWGLQVWWDLKKSKSRHGQVGEL